VYVLSIQGVVVVVTTTNFKVSGAGALTDKLFIRVAACDARSFRRSPAIRDIHAMLVRQSIASIACDGRAPRARPPLTRALRQYGRTSWSDPCCDASRCRI
jgi:hypothetical protein